MVQLNHEELCEVYRQAENLRFSWDINNGRNDSMHNDQNVNSKARERLGLLFDDGVYNEIGSLMTEKGKPSGVVCAFGYVNGNEVYAFAQDKEESGGAVGQAQANKIAKVYDMAAKTGAPVVGIHDSNGAFMDGTAASLAAYGKMLEASATVSGVVPQIAVIAGTCAGSASILACSSDFVIMTKESEFFLAPNTSAGSAEAASESGIACDVCGDEAAAFAKARDIINLMPMNNLATLPAFEFEGAVGTGSDISDIADKDSVVELSADCGSASKTALATLGGSTVGFVSAGNGAKMKAKDLNKIARFVRTCDAFSIPVITLVSSEGIDEECTMKAVKAVTTLANSYSEATTVKVAVVTGKTVGPVYTAVAGNSSNSDLTYAYNNAVIAPIPSEGAVEFLWHDKLKGASDLTAERNKLVSEYEATLASAQTAAENGYVDGIVDASTVRQTLISALDILAGKRVSKLPKKHNNIRF